MSDDPRPRAATLSQSPAAKRAARRVDCYWVGGEMGDVDVPVGASVLFGRSVDCDVVVLDVAVSRRHLRLTGIQDGLLLEDLGSANGTKVNDEPVSGPRLLVGGEVIRLGGQNLWVYARSQPPVDPRRATTRRDSPDLLEEETTLSAPIPPELP